MGEFSESLFQEEVIGSKENSPPQPDFEEFTYKHVITYVKRIADYWL